MRTPVPVSRRTLVASVVLLVAAAAALGGAAAVGWAQVGFQVPLRGTLTVRVGGADLLAALGPLALLTLAAVAAVLATGGRTRQVLGALLLGTAIPPVVGAAWVGDERRLMEAAAAAGRLPARSVPDGTVTVLLAGPVLAATGAVLLAAASAVLVLRGHRMPRMGRRYRAPAARASAARASAARASPPPNQKWRDREWGERKPGEPEQGERELPNQELWERIDAGEDPTVSDHPR